MRPDPITYNEGRERIPLPGGVVTAPRNEFTKTVVHGGILHVARATHAALTAQADEIDRLRAENAELRNALKAASLALNESADSVESWASYASQYMQQKHDLGGCVARIMDASKAAIDAAMAKEST